MSHFPGIPLDRKTAADDQWRKTQELLNLTRPKISSDGGALVVTIDSDGGELVLMMDIACAGRMGLMP
jgi:Fe-S cluster biogenesis protein NfuA